MTSAGNSVKLVFSIFYNKAGQRICMRWHSIFNVVVGRLKVGLQLRLHTARWSMVQPLDQTLTTEFEEPGSTSG